MNQKQFLEQIHQTAGSASVEQLTLLLHRQALALPTEQRADFLKSLQKAAASTNPAEEMAEAEQNIRKQTDQALKEVSGDLSDIVRGEKVLVHYPAKGRGSKQRYEDPDGIGQALDGAAALLSTLLDQGRYTDGLQLGMILFGMAVTCREAERETTSEETMTETAPTSSKKNRSTRAQVTSKAAGKTLRVSELQHLGLMQTPWQDISAALLACVYQMADREARPQGFVRILQQLKPSSMTLGDTLGRYAGELSEWPEFLEDLILHLGTKKSALADSLFLEAIAMVPLDFALDCMEIYCKKHPGIFAAILDAHPELSTERLLEIAQKGIDLLPKTSPERQDLTRRMSGLRSLQAERASRDQMHLAAFARERSGLSYLQALLLSEDPQRMRAQLHEIVSSLPPVPAAESAGTPAEQGTAGEAGTDKPKRRTAAQAAAERQQRVSRHMDRAHWLALLVLDGRFDLILEQGLIPESASDWNGGFLPEILALLLLYLGPERPEGAGLLQMQINARFILGYTDHAWLQELRLMPGDACDAFMRSFEKSGGPVSSASIDRIDRSQFSAAVPEAPFSLSELFPYGEADVFPLVLEQWKALTPADETTRQKLLQRIAELVQERTTAVHEARQDGYYVECASLLAALGEVREANGEHGAKQALMSAWQQKYPRRRTFVADLRDYGWTGPGKES